MPASLSVSSRSGATTADSSGEAPRLVGAPRRSDWWQFGIIGYSPGETGSLLFFWRFEDDGDGTRITCRIAAEGPGVDRHLERFQGMGERLPLALAALAARLDELSPGEAWRGVMGAGAVADLSEQAGLAIN